MSPGGRLGGNGPLPRAVAWIVLLTGVNAIVCVLNYELGFGPATFLFGPADRFGDLVKLGLSYKGLLAPYVTELQLARWPALFRGYYLSGDYAAVAAAGAPQISNLHLPPLGQLLAMGVGLVTVLLRNPAGVLPLFLLVHAVAAAVAIRGALPASDRSPTLLAGAGVVLFLSYPALFLLTRGNLHSALTSLGIIAFCLALFRRGTAGLGALLALAIAVNFRPNAALFALALPLRLGLRASLPHLARLALLAGALFLASLGIARQLHPGYGLASFLAGLRAYGELYVAGSHGDAFNSSLLGLLKILGGGWMSMNGVLLLFNLLAVVLVLLAWLAVRTGRLPGSAVCFLLAACYALCTPVFGDYHLLVFLAPLLLLHLEAGASPRWDAVAGAVAIASVLLLSAKNLGSWRGHSFQLILNPLIATAALLTVARRALSPATPVGSET